MPAKIYDWAEWFGQRRFVLCRGIHYRCSTSSICQQVRNNATRIGVHVSVMDDGDRVVVTVDRENHHAQNIN